MARAAPRKSATPRVRRSADPIRFAFGGFCNGWYRLQADVADQRGMDVLAVEAQITSWLVNQGITPHTLCQFATGLTGQYPFAPSERRAMCLLLKRAPDVLRFSFTFACTGLSKDSFFEAVSAEAKVVRLGVDHLAQIAYESVASFARIGGDSDPPWESLDGERRTEIIARAQHYLNAPKASGEKVHQVWLSDRLKQGWRYGPEGNERQKIDPALIPWNDLTEPSRSRYSLFAAVVASLEPMLAHRP